MSNTLTVGDALLVCVLFLAGFVSGTYAERVERRARARQFMQEQREGMSPVRDYRTPRITGTRRHHN